MLIGYVIFLFAILGVTLTIQYRAYKKSQGRGV